MATTPSNPECTATRDLDTGRLPLPREGFVLESSQQTGPPPSPYLGRPAVPGLTAITPRIRATKLAGHAPASILFSACESATVADAGADAFADLHHDWDMGDGTVYRGKPAVLHTYETTGSHTVTLTSWGRTTDGAFVSAATSTVAATSKSLVRAHSATTGSFALRAVVGKRQPASARCRNSPSRALQIPSPHGIAPGAGGFTIAGWFRVYESATLNMVVAGLYSNATAGSRPLRIRYLGSTNSGRIEATCNNTQTATTVGSGYGTGAWHWICAEVDLVSSPGNRIVRLTIDSETPVTASVTATTIDTGSDFPFVLGNTYSSTATTKMLSGISGDLQHFAVWNRSLTDPERASLYNAGAGVDYDDAIAAQASLANQLLAWWPLDEPFGVRRDVSGNGRDLLDSPIAGATTAGCGVTSGGAAVYPSGGETTAPILYDDGLGHFSGDGGPGNDYQPVEFPEEEWARRTGRVVAALEALPSIGPGNVRQLGREYVEFGGALAGTPVAICPGAGSGGFDGSIVVGPEGLPAGTAAAITIEDWPTRYATAYFDSAGSGDGTTTGSRSNLATVLKTWLEKPGGGVRIVIARGSTFTLPSVATLGGGGLAAPVLIEADGTGANPIIQGPTQLLTYYGNVAAGLAGFTVKDVDLVATTGDQVIFAPSGDLTGATVPSIRDGFHLIGCRIEAAKSLDGMVQLESYQGGNFTFDACQFIRGAPDPADAAQKPLALDPEALRDLATKDCVWQGGGGNQSDSHAYSHHCYIHCFGHQLHSNPTFLATSDNGAGGVYPQNNCIKLSALDGVKILFLFLDGGDYGAGGSRIAIARQANLRPLASVFDQVVIQGIDFHEEDHGGFGYGIYAAGVLGLTVRDCDFWGIHRACVEPSCEAGGFDPNPSIGTTAYARVDLRVYRNRASIPDHAIAGYDRASFLDIDHFTGLEVLDNEVVGAAPNPTIVKMPFAKAAAVAASFRNRTYYAPSGTMRFVDVPSNGAGVARTLSDWRAQPFAPDPPASLSTADPRWTAPSDGDFAPRPIEPLTVTSSIRVAGPTTVEVLGDHEGGIEPYSIVVERAPDAPSEPYSFEAIGTATSGETFFDTTIVPGRSYHYRIAVVDGSGQTVMGPGSQVRIAPAPLAKPTSLVLSSPSPSPGAMSLRGRVGAPSRQWRGGWNR